MDRLIPKSELENLSISAKEKLVQKYFENKSKKMLTGLILLGFFGLFGAHRLYVGQRIKAIIPLCLIILGSFILPILLDPYSASIVDYLYPKSPLKDDMKSSVFMVILFLMYISCVLIIYEPIALYNNIKKVNAVLLDKLNNEARLVNLSDKETND